MVSATFRLPVVMLVLVAGLPASHGQHAIVGQVQDTDAKPVPFCNSFVRQDGVVRRLSTTDELGIFLLAGLDTGDYELVVSSIGYKKHTSKLRVETGDVKVEITLLADTVVLHEVIVHEEAPIKMKGDTVVYSAQYFARGDEVALADLLKRLPGISVGDDGKVKYQGKAVSRIKIEDDDLFDANYQLLTRNLPARWVEGVEVLQHYSDNAMLKNMEDSDEVALNITLKTERKHELLGDFRGGTNFSQRHEANLNLASLRPKTKWYALSSANNLGDDLTGSAEELVNPSAQGPQLVGDGLGSSFLVPVSKPYLPEFRRDRYYNNEAAFGSLQVLHKFSKSLTMKIQGYGLRDAVDFAQASRSDYFTPYDTVRYQELAATRNKESLWHLSSNLSWKARADFMLQYRGRIEGLSEQAGLQSNFNQLDVRDDLIASASRQDHSLKLMWRQSDRTAMLGFVRYFADDRPQTYRIDGNVLNSFFWQASPSDSLRQVNGFDTQFLGGEVQWYRRVEFGRMGVKAKVSHEIQRLGTQLASTAGNLASNDLKYDRQQVSADVYFARQVGHWVITPALEVRSVETSFNDRADRGVFFALPRFGMKWNAGKGDFSFIYTWSGQVSEPDQLTRSPMLRHYNYVAVQDSGFHQFSQRTLLSTYHWGGWGQGFSFQASLFHQESPGAYLGDVDVEPNYTATTTNRVADRSMSSLALEADKYFAPVSTNLKIRWTANRASFVTSVESILAETATTGHILEASLRTGFQGPLNAHGGYVVHVNSAKSNLLSATNYSYMLFLDGYFRDTRKRLTVTLHWERYQLASLQGSPTFNFLDLWANLKIKDGIELYVKGRNLLGESVYAQRSISSQMVIELANSLILRYILVGIQIRL